MMGHGSAISQERGMIRASIEHHHERQINKGKDYLSGEDKFRCIDGVYTVIDPGAPDMQRKGMSAAAYRKRMAAQGIRFSVVQNHQGESKDGSQEIL